MFQQLTLGKNQTVIQGHDVSINTEQLNQYVAGYQIQLISKNIKTCVLLTNDTLEFVAGFLACQYLGVEIYLPPNDSEEMLACIKVDGSIGNFNKSLKLQKKGEKVINKGINIRINIFTSGSTGKPKKISRSFTQMLKEVAEIKQMFSEHAKSTLFASTVSYQHIYGLLFSILWPLKNGFKIWNKILQYEESLQSITNQYDSLVLISSPAFLKRLSDYNCNKATCLDIFSSGGELKFEQHKIANQHLNSSIVQVYGSSETGGIASKTLGQNWSFFPSVEYKAIDDVLYVKSPFCYTHDWHNTNDIVQFNKKGFILKGRCDRIVKIEEKRVSLIQVEKVLSKLSFIKDVHVIYRHEKRQYLAAIIVLENLAHVSDEKLIKRSIKDYLKNKVEKLAIPRQIRFVVQLPMNSQGKLIHKEILRILK